MSGGTIVFDLERFTRSPKMASGSSTWPPGLLVLDSESEYDLRTPNGKKAFRDAINAAAYYSDRLSTRSLAARSSRRSEANRTVATGHSGSSRPDHRARGRSRVLRDLTARLLAGESRTC